MRLLSKLICKILDDEIKTSKCIAYFAGLPNFRRGISPASELKPTDMKAVLKEIAIERKAITLGELLLEGKNIFFSLNLLLQ